MLLTFIYWSFVFCLISIIGHAFIEYIGKHLPESEEFYLEEYFFIGFILLATISAYGSIFIPINWIILLLILLIGFGLYQLNNIKINKLLSKTYLKYSALNTIEKSFLLSILFFLIIMASNEIWVYDTKLYHAQNIQWIQKFAVVPGLGNFQPQFGFNNLFFPITALFSLDIANFCGISPVLLYPFNGIMISLLFLKIGFFIRTELAVNNWWRAAFYILIFGFCFTLFPRALNSPAPDYICAVIIIYTFLVLEKNNFNLSTYHCLFFSALISTAIVFKLSALLLGILLLPLIRINHTYKKTMLIIGLACFIGLPFIIRNYYLTGYLIFPFPYIDLFNPEWKIPYEIVDFEKLVVTSWAKVPNSNPTQIGAMPFFTWFQTWWEAKDLIWKPILLANTLSLFSILIFLKKEKTQFALLQGVVLINLLFWFYNAPDPRFAFGFLFIGASLSICSFLLIGDLWKYLTERLLLTVFALFLIFSLNFHKLYLKDFLLNPITWVIPKGLAPSNLKKVTTNFTYSMPIRPSLCHNSGIPCTTRPLGYIELRDSSDMQKGFKLIEKE